MAQYGVSATYLLKQRLLAEIKNELLFTDKSISEIAYAFNFSEPPHRCVFSSSRRARHAENSKRTIRMVCMNENDLYS